MQRERAAVEPLDRPGAAADTLMNTWSLAVLDSWMQLFRWWQDQYLSVLGVWAFPFQAMQMGMLRGLRSPYFHEAPAITAQDTGLAGGATQESTAGNLPGMRENLVRGTDNSQLHFGVDNPIFIEYLRSMAEQCFAVGNHSLALLYLRVAEEREDRLISQMFSFVSEGKRLEYLQAFQDHLSEVLSRVIQLRADPAAVRFGLDLVLRRKGLAAEAFAVQRDAVFAGNHPELAPAFQRRYELQQQIARLRLDGPVTESLDAFRQRLAELSAELNRLDEEIVREMPSLNRAIEHVLRAADCRSVAGCLPEGSVLIEFVHVVQSTPAQGADVLSERYVAFVLCAGDSEHVQLFDLGDARVIDQQILAFRTAITGETETRGKFAFADDRDAYRVSSGQSLVHDQGKVLYDLVFAPLAPALRGRRRVFLAPDGKLNLVPFEALPSRKKHCLIDDYEMSYLGVGRDLLRFGAQPTGEPAEPMVLAAPNFDLHSESEARPEDPSSTGLQSRDLSRAVVNFPPLPGTYEEGQRVAALLSVKPYMGDAAVEARLKTARSPRILHLATHGYFLSGQVEAEDASSTPQDKGGAGAARRSGAGAENPLLRSGLALAGANTRLQGKPLPVEAEDGILNAVDVSGLDLLNTEMVVLSACQTGLGDVRPGEGVFGLRRAFAQAGAQTLVISLWKAPDLATAILMEQFYQRLCSGLPLLAARYQLSGCVNDVELMADILQHSFGFPAEQITLLKDEQATRDGILAAMNRLVEQAGENDIVLLGYSGHGSQMTDREGDEPDEKDETIMPHDSGRDSYPNRDITDDEIYAWLLKVTQKTPYVTLIFDCCHSGTISRDVFGTASRWVEPDLRPIEELPPSPVSPEVALASSRDVGGSGLLPIGERYVLIAACQDKESAYEYGARQNGQVVLHGALTYFLSQELTKAAPGSTYREIFEQASTHLTAAESRQHPQMEGARDRELFGVRNIEPMRFVPVKERKGDLVTLRAGAAHGMTVGSQWAIYPSGTRQVDAQTSRLGLVEIIAVRAVSSDAHITNETSPNAIVVGARAVEEAHFYGEMRLVVDIQAPADYAAHVEQIDQIIAGSNLLRRANLDEPADVRIYIIPPRTEATRGDPVPQLQTITAATWAVVGKDGLLLMPLHAVADTNAIYVLRDNLEKVVRYSQALALDNPHQDSPLKGKVEFVLKRQDKQADNAWVVALPEDSSGHIVYKEGDRIAAAITNHHDAPVYISGLDFGLTGAVSLVYPVEGASEPLAPGRTIEIGMRQGDEIELYVPDNFPYLPYPEDEMPAGGAETFMLLATTHEADFSALVQEPYRGAPMRGEKGGNSPFGQLLELALTGCGTRDPRRTQVPPDEAWIAVKRSFFLRRNGL